MRNALGFNRELSCLWLWVVENLGPNNWFTVFFRILNMKRYIVLFIVLFFSVCAYAQLEVKPGSFKEVVGFVNIDPDKQTDDNDKPYAVLKIKTENISSKQRRELSFKGDAQTFFEVEYKDGEVWLYISYYATYIKISHEEFSSTEFHFPFDMEPKKGYELTLVNKASPVINGWASLTIKTNPEIRANIKLNGRDLNETTPYTNGMIPSGKYEIVLSKDRYKTTTHNIEILDGDTAVVELTLPIDVAVITLAADDYTEVIIDGKYIQKGTWSGELYSGNHEIFYRKPRHKDAKLTILVEGGVSKKYELKPEPINGVINVDTEPSGATVYIDGIKYGSTPITINDVIIGKHELKLDKSGFGIIIESFTLAEDEPVIINEDLLNGQEITITTGSTSADVFVDGQPIGKSPIKTAVSFGRHTISAYTEDKSATDFIIITRENGPQNVELVLRKETLASYAKPGYKFITLNGAINQHNDLSYGLTIGSIKKYGWFASVMTSFAFKGYDPDYECDADFFVDGIYPDYTGKNSCTRLSVIGGLLLFDDSEPISFKVGIGYGIRAKTYETTSGYWVKNSSTSEHGVDFSIGLQSIFRGLVVSVDAVTTNFEIFEAKIGLGWGLKNK